MVICPFTFSFPKAPGPSLGVTCVLSNPDVVVALALPWLQVDPGSLKKLACFQKSGFYGWAGTQTHVHTLWPGLCGTKDSIQH
jgi:hypothetical protein